MALNDIKQSITEQAQQQANEIISQARDEAKKLQQEWEEKYSEKQTQLLAAAKRKAQQKIQQATFSLQAQTQTLVLNKKQKVITSVYEKAIEKLASQNEHEQATLIESLVATLPDTEGEIVATTENQTLVKKVIKKSNKKLTPSEKTIKAKGGFIFVGKTIEIDNTYEALINNSKEETLLAVTETVFGKQE